MLFIQFLHPAFLYGLLALSVPVIIHLFSFKKYKKVYFSNFNFLASLQQQRKNSSRLKNLLLLLLRLIVIAAIVIAFASPYIAPAHSHSNSGSSSRIIIYVDNSFSMTNTGSKGSLLEEAKKNLFDIVSTYPSGASFHLLTNDDVNSSLLTKEQILSALSGLKPSQGIKPLSQIYKETRELTNNKPTTLFILSDFQKQNCDFQQVATDSLTESILLLFRPENKNNLYIKEVVMEQAFHKKNQSDKVRITIANSSDKEFENIPVSLSINNKKKSVNKISVPANGEQTVEISYLNTENGFYKGVAEISDFPVVFDNKYYFSYHIGGNSAILYIGPDNYNPYFEKLFSDTASFSFTRIHNNQIANLKLNRYNLIILDRMASSSSGWEGALEEYIAGGGSVFLLPGIDNAISASNRLLQKLKAPIYGHSDTNTVISTIETQATLFRDVFEQQGKQVVLPHVQRFYHLGNSSQAELLLSDKQGNCLLAAQPFGKGIVYISAFDYLPENSDMVYHPLFVPLMANMASGISANLTTSYFLDSDKPVRLNNQINIENTQMRIRDEAGTLEFIPEIRKDFSGDLILSSLRDIPGAGLFEVIQDSQLADVLAFNYNRNESQMDFCSEDELQQHFPEARIENIKTTQIDHNNQLIKEIVLQDNNTYLAFWFLLLAIIALLIEQMVWKKKLN